MKTRCGWRRGPRFSGHCQVERVAGTVGGRVIGHPQIEPHQYEERPENTLGLPERQTEEKTPRQGRFNREVRILPLRAPGARSVRFPGGDGRRR